VNILTVSITKVFHTSSLLGVLSLRFSGRHTFTFVSSGPSSIQSDQIIKLPRQFESFLDPPLLSTAFSELLLV
jgi:hypothetical protein